MCMQGRRVGSWTEIKMKPLGSSKWKVGGKGWVNRGVIRYHIAQGKIYR